MGAYEINRIHGLLFSQQENQHEPKKILFRTIRTRFYHRRVTKSMADINQLKPMYRMCESFAWQAYPSYDQRCIQNHDRSDILREETNIKSIPCARLRQQLKYVAVAWSAWP